MTEAFDPQSDDGQIDGTVPDVVAIQEFRDARDLLLAHGGDYEAAYRDFRWPRLETFNWKVDWFDGVLAAEQPGQRALWIVEEDGSETALTFAELSARASQLAQSRRRPGVDPDHPGPAAAQRERRRDARAGEPHDEERPRRERWAGPHPMLWR